MEIGLEYLSFYLGEAYLKIDLYFLNKLLKDASKSEKPHKNKEFCKKIRCSMNKTKKVSMSVLNWAKGYRTVPLSKLIKIIKLSNYSWKDIEKNLISIKPGIRHGEAYFNFPIKLDEKLGSIIGHILGDGSIDKRFHSTFYSNLDITLLKEFRDNMNLIFGIEPRIWIQEKKDFNEKSKWMKRVNSINQIPKNYNVGLFYPKICSDILYITCGKFAEGKNKKITKKIKNMNKNFKKGFIRAFFDDECSIRQDNYSIRLHQDNKIILKDIRQILKEFNINSNVIRYYTKRNKLRYYFNITGFKNYYTFFEIIGCTSPNKKRELKVLINKVKNSKYFRKKYILPNFNNSNSLAISSY